MPKTTMSLWTLRARPKNQSHRGGLTDVDGSHYLAHLYAFIDSLPRKSIDQTDKQRYVQVIDLIRRGNSLTIVTKSGYYGETGAAVNRHTGKEMYVTKTDEAFTRQTRTTVYIPPNATVGVAALEYKSGAVNGGVLLDAFRREMLDRFDGFYFPSETVQEKEAWSASGKLRQVTVVQHQHPVNLADGAASDDDDEIVLGELVHSAIPPKGQRHWPTSVWDRIRNRSLDASKFVGLRQEDDQADTNESVYVTVERDGRQKRFQLGTDGRPSIREVLTEDTEPALDLAGFHREADRSVRALYKDMKKSWKPGWFADTSGDATWVDHRWH